MQAQIVENFSDGNFTNNPIWVGDTAKFRINDAKILQTNALSAGTARIFTNYTVPDSLFWTFWMNLDFEPSASNMARVYFQMEQPNDFTKSQAYYIEAGEDGAKDALKLFRQENGGKTKLLASGKIGAMATATKARIRIQYKVATKTWLLETDYTGGTSFQTEFEQKDTLYNKPKTAWFGLACTFTATRGKLFSFDDIFVGKSAPPSPPIEPITKIEPYDILINEIMPDPSPTVGLPDAEYIELYNRSNKRIDLAALHLWKDGKNYAFPTFSLSPKAYITLCNISKVAILKDFGEVLGMTSFPELTNIGVKIALQTKEGQFIHTLNYTPDLFTDDKKRDGGWSLELINPNAPCDGTTNWQAAKSEIGGTPSKQNSVFSTEKSDKKLAIASAFPINANTIQVTFTKNIAENMGNNRDLFQLIDNNILQANILSPDFRQVILKIEKPLEPKNRYELSVKTTFADCLNQPIDGNNSIKIALPETPSAKDIVINEVLFNPILGGEDFIELFNRSNKVLNIKDIYINNTLKDKKTTAIDTNWLFFPKEYVVLTSKTFDVVEKFSAAQPQAILPVNLPALNDDEGNISLIFLQNNQQIWIDSFMYNERLHSPLLSNREGVSLERIDPEASTQSAQNWASAASASGFGTPTRQNSQFLDIQNIENTTLLTIPDITFSPDGDGNKDFLSMEYAMPKAGFIGNITIFDSAGRVIKHLLKNELLATEGFFRWEGDTDDGQIAKTGMYVVFGEFFEAKGAVLRAKKACVLVR